MRDLSSRTSSDLGLPSHTQQEGRNIPLICKSQPNFLVTDDTNNYAFFLPSTGVEKKESQENFRGAIIFRAHCDLSCFLLLIPGMHPLYKFTFFISFVPHIVAFKMWFEKAIFIKNKKNTYLTSLARAYYIHHTKG
jgi:hypothetical protein